MDRDGRRQCSAPWSQPDEAVGILLETNQGGPRSWLGTSSVPRFRKNRTFCANVGHPAPLRCAALPAILDAAARRQAPPRVRTLVIGAGQAVPVTSYRLVPHSVEHQVLGAAGCARAVSGRTGGTRSTWTPQPLVHVAGADVRRSRAGRLPPPESDPEAVSWTGQLGTSFNAPASRRADKHTPQGQR